MSPLNDRAPDLETLRGIISPQKPFGPWEAETGQRNPAAAEALFVTENLLHIEAAGTAPTIIVGRRGSGKTAFLKSPTTHVGSRSLELKTSQCFAVIERALSRWDDHRLAYYLSHVRALWRASFWHSVFANIIEQDDDWALEHSELIQAFEAIDTYLRDLTGKKKATPMEAFSAFCNALAEASSEELDLLVYDSDSYAGKSVSFRTARKAAQRLLSAKGARVMILLDSMEDFARVRDIPDRSMEGLLSVLGERSRTDEPFSARLALPAELYFHVVRMSSNPLKDLNHIQLLHWSAPELVRIVARRFAMYCELYDNGLPRRLGFSDWVAGDGIKEEALLRAVLPGTVINQMQGVEDSVAYLLRHTQLLPRHLIVLLNRVWTQHLADDRGRDRISSHAVRKAVGDAEKSIVWEICEGYRPVHPNVEKVCENLIPQCDLRMSWGELHKKYNSFGRKHNDGKDYDEGRRMLIEIGALGREILSEERYILAEFEYTMPSRLGIADDQLLCLHPLFAGYFGVRQAQGDAGIGHRAIYPYGCLPEGPDPRLGSAVEER